MWFLLKEVRNKNVIVVLCAPVLDVFPDDEEVGLDEPFDYLTVPLLPGRQFPGDGHGLKGKAKLLHLRNFLQSTDYKTNNQFENKFDNT